MWAERTHASVRVIRGGMPRLGTRGSAVSWTSSGAPASREGGIWVVCRELSSGAVLDESLVQQPLDSPPLGSSITQGMPSRDQFGVVFIDLVLEAPECSLPL